MAAIDKTTMAYLLKQMYVKGTIEKEAYSKRPFLALVTKNTNARGKTIEVPVTYSDPAGVSNTFASAQSARSAAGGDRFSITKGKIYGSATIQFEAIEDSKGDQAAYMELLKHGVNGLLNNVSHRAAIQLYRDGSGAIGQRASASTNVITLVNAADAHLFQKNMVVVAAATKTGTIRSGSTTVVGVDRSNGKITLASAAAISSFADNDYLFPLGDAQNNGSSSLGITGLQSWFPSTAPTSTAFYGVDRTSDIELLAGHRFDATGATVEEAAIEIAEIIAAIGGTPDHVFMNSSEYKAFLKLKQGQATYEMTSNPKMAQISFKALTIDYSRGTLKVLPDPVAPKGVFSCLQMDTLVMGSAGEFPRLFEEGGDPKITIADDDAAEIRSNNYVQLWCTNPGYNGVAYNVGA